MPFSCFSLFLSSAFVFLSALYFAPHYPVPGQSIRGVGGGGSSSGPWDKGSGDLRTNSVWSKNKGARAPWLLPWIRHCYRNACKRLWLVKTMKQRYMLIDYNPGVNREETSRYHGSKISKSWQKELKQRDLWHSTSAQSLCSLSLYYAKLLFR